MRLVSLMLNLSTKVWNEGTPGTEGGIRLFLTEIINLLEVACESAQWRVKAQAARAIGKVAQKLGKSGSFPIKGQKRCMALLLNGLAGRTWTGKEALLGALADLCQHGSVKEMAADTSGEIQVWSLYTVQYAPNCLEHRKCIKMDLKCQLLCSTASTYWIIYSWLTSNPKISIWVHTRAKIHSFSKCQNSDHF